MNSTSTKIKEASGKVAPSDIMGSDPNPGAEDRLNFIASAAYYKAETRGFMPGKELDDWLEAEAKFDATAWR